jgi:catechol 2,3-dioxygenase-like lactoylglutathione lyase family enzyme
VLGESPFIGFIPVTDVSRARDFYEGTLGLRILEESPFAMVADANGTMLRITPVGEFAPQAFTVAGWKVADITDTVSTLTDKGVAFRRYDGMEQDDLGIWTTPSGDRVAWFSDPDDNALSLTTFADQP